MLGKLLDTIDTVDIDIVRSDADEKDPVLMARRQRTRNPKENILRSSNWHDGQPDFLQTKSQKELTDGQPQQAKATQRRPSLLTAALKSL